MSQKSTDSIHTYTRKLWYLKLVFLILIVGCKAMLHLWSIYIRQNIWHLSPITCHRCYQKQTMCHHHFYCLDRKIYFAIPFCGLSDLLFIGFSCFVDGPPTFHSYFQQNDKKSLVVMEAAWSFEMFVSYHNSTQRHKPECLHLNFKVFHPV